MTRPDVDPVNDINTCWPESKCDTVSCLLSRQSMMASSSSSLSVGSSVTTTSSSLSLTASSEDSGSSCLHTIRYSMQPDSEQQNAITSTSEPDHCLSPCSLTMTSLNGSSSSVTAGGSTTTASNATNEPGCTKPFRSFKSSDEYLIAMKEDLAEWLNQLYDLDISVEKFIPSLENGVILCRYWKGESLPNCLALYSFRPLLIHLWLLCSTRKLIHSFSVSQENGSLSLSFLLKRRGERMNGENERRRCVWAGCPSLFPICVISFSLSSLHFTSSYMQS